MTHLWWYIKRFGSPLNFDNSPTDHNHIPIKRHGRRSSQHSDDDYRLGSCKRIQESTALHKGNCYLNRTANKGNDHTGYSMGTLDVVDDDLEDTLEEPTDDEVSKYPDCVIFYQPGLIYTHINQRTDTNYEKGGRMIIYPVRKGQLSVDDNVLHPSVIEYLQEQLHLRGKNIAVVHGESIKTGVNMRKKLYIEQKKISEKRGVGMTGVGSIGN